MKRPLLLLSLLVLVTLAHASPIYFGDWGGYRISESGKINRDVRLLQMKSRSETSPFLILGGDFITIARYPKRDKSPLYLFDDLSTELENLRINALVNLHPWLFFETNYQINNNFFLDYFFTFGNLKESPIYLTVGKQYLPYGDFNKYDVEANPLTKTVFRVNQMAATFGLKFPHHHVKLIAAPEHARFGLAYENKMDLKNIKLTQGVGYISNIVDGTRALRSLRPREQNNAQAVDYYAIWDFKKVQLRMELDSALDKVEDIKHLSAYDLEAQYRFHFFHRASKFILSTSGLFNANRLNHNASFRDLGIFTRQYVVSIKHRLHRNVTLGLAAILGKKLKYEKQAVINLVVKV